jgi:hypothetical protein
MPFAYTRFALQGFVSLGVSATLLDMTPELAVLLLEHKWLPALAIVIGLLIRVLKGDVRGPTIAKKYRAPLAFGLGLVLGVVQRRVSGASWVHAILAGIVTGAMPILGHSLFIKRLRKGLELPIPGLMKPRAPGKTNGAGPREESAS